MVSPPMSRIEHSRKTLLEIVSATLAFKGHCCQKCMEEKANLVRITNSTRIACCGKNDLSVL